MTRISATGISAQISRRRVVAGVAGLALVGFAGRAAIAEPRAFFVFFNANSSEISPTAMQIVAAVKGFIKPNTRTTIVGHCDTSEKDPDTLSLARANAVLTALATLPAGAIAVPSGKGTAEPQKPTGANAPEPQNRYVSITVQ